MNKNELSISFLTKTKQMIKDKATEPSFAVIYNNIATMYFSKEMYYKAINYSKKTLSIVEDEVIQRGSGSIYTFS